MFRVCCRCAAVSWVASGCLLRKTFLGCLELSIDRLEGAEEALTALAEALPDASLAVELLGRPAAGCARVCFQAYLSGWARRDDVCGIFVVALVGGTSMAAIRADSAALRALRLREGGKSSALVSI